MQVTLEPDPAPGPSPRGAGDSLAFAQKVLTATAVVALVAILLLLVWYASDLLLLLFAAVLVSIPLRRLQHLLERTTGLGEGASLALVTIALLAGVVALVAVSAERLGSQVDQFVTQFRAALEALRERAGNSAWVQDAVERLPNLGEVVLGRGGVLSRVTGFASSTLAALINAVIVVIIGVYLASQPRLYSSGIRRLLPHRSRGRAGEVLHVLDEALGRWLVGRLVLMVINGSLTAIALWAIGVPLAFTLGIIAGALNFIPNFGPFIAAVPAVLIALMQGPWLALYTALIYLAVQMIDGYVLTPLVDRQSVQLPPALTITAQLLLGLMFGFVGLLVASPLTATAMILVKMLYVEDVLGDRVMSEPEAQAVRSPSASRARA